MKNSLQDLMDYYKINAAQFAENIGIQRSSISHFLSGRNNPSLDVIRKILVAYPGVSADWLLFGNGEMLKETPNNTIKVEKEALPATPNIFSVIKEEDQLPYGLKDTDKKPNSTFSQEKTTPPPTDQSSVQHQPEVEIERVLIFYKNGTFKEYIAQ